MTEEELSTLIDGLDYYLDHPSLTTTERTDIQRARDVLSRIHAELFDESGEDQFMTTPTKSARDTITDLKGYFWAAPVAEPINNAIAYLETIAPHPYDEMTMEQLFDEAIDKRILVHVSYLAGGHGWVWGSTGEKAVDGPSPIEALRTFLKEATK